MVDEKPDSTDPGGEEPAKKARRPRRASKSGDGEKAATPAKSAAKPRRARRKAAAEPEGEAAKPAKAEAAAESEGTGAPEAEAKPKPKARPRRKAAGAEGAETKRKPKAAGASKAETKAESKAAGDTETEAKPEPAEEPQAAEATPEAGAPAQDGESAERATAPAPRRARDASAGPPVVRAQARYVRSSARKARLVCDHLRGKSVEEARAILSQANRAVARDWSKLLESAVANAEHNHDLDGDELRVLRVHADEGPTLKRFRPRAMGRATRIRKRTTHLAIELTPKEQR